jgi:hypothetical protein
MKSLILFLFFCSLVGTGVKAQATIESVNTVDEALSYISNNAASSPKLLQLHALYDTAINYRFLFKGEQGKVYRNDGLLYKIIKDTAASFSRVQYIFLDGGKLSKLLIDSTRNEILRKHTAGVNFGLLIKQYNMDGGTGDTGWFTDGTMVRQFQRAVLKQKAGAVFTVDIPSLNWYYVVNKLAETRYARVIWVLRIME